MTVIKLSHVKKAHIPLNIFIRFVYLMQTCSLSMFLLVYLLYSSKPEALDFPGLEIFMEHIVA